METMDNATAERLRSYIERIERLTEEKKPFRPISRTFTPRPKAPDTTQKSCA